MKSPNELIWFIIIQVSSRRRCSMARTSLSDRQVHRGRYCASWWHHWLICWDNSKLTVVLSCTYLLSEHKKRPHFNQLSFGSVSRAIQLRHPFFHLLGVSHIQPLCFFWFSLWFLFYDFISLSFTCTLINEWSWVCAVLNLKQTKKKVHI